MTDVWTIDASKTAHLQFTTAAAATCLASFMKTGDLHRTTPVVETVAMSLSVHQQVREVEGTSLLCLSATPERRSRTCSSHLDLCDHPLKIRTTEDSISQQIQCRLPDHGVRTTPPNLTFSQCLGQASGRMCSRSHQRLLLPPGRRHRNHPVFTRVVWNRSSVGHRALPYRPTCRIRQVGLAAVVEDRKTLCLRLLAEGLQLDPPLRSEAPEAATIHWVRSTVF
jgi:hypothetical protein